MSYQAPPPPPPGGGYGQPAPYGGGAAPKTSVMAIISLISSILGIFPCCGCLVFGVGGAILGYLAKKEIAESNGAKTGDGLAKWGFILGLVGVGLGIAYWIAAATGVIPTTFEYSSNFGN